MMTVPADGAAHTILIRDQEDNTCSLMIPLSALTHCSDACEIIATVSEVYCNNNGTNQTDADDVFYIVVQVNGSNIPSGSWALNGTAITGVLGATDTLGPYLILDGPQSLVFQATGVSCSDNIIVDPPPACSSCSQSIDAGPDVLLDCGTPDATLTVVSSDPGTASWTDPSGGVTQAATIDISLSGQYIATVSFPDGCVSKDTVIVTADPTLPNVWGGPDMALDCEVDQVVLQSQVL
jgi:hypothetical protein